MAVTLSEKAAQHVANYMSKRGKGIGLRLGVRMWLGRSNKAAGQRDSIDKIELRRRANGYCTGGRSGLRCALTQMRNIHKAGASNTRRQSLHSLLAQGI